MGWAILYGILAGISSVVIAFAVDELRKRKRRSRKNDGVLNIDTTTGDMLMFLELDEDLVRTMQDCDQVTFTVRRSDAPR